MKTCLVANPNSAHTRRLAEGLLVRRHTVTLIAQERPQTPLPDGLRVIVPAMRYDFPKLRYLAWSMEMPGLVRHLQPDVLHAVSASGAAWLAAAARFHPLIVTATGSDLLLLPHRSWLHNWLTRRALRRADKVLCLSPQLAQAAKAIRVPAERIEQNFFGIDLDIFFPAHNHQAPAQRIISLRAMKDIYNPTDIARAIPLVLQKAPQARFWILTYNADPQILAEFQSIVDQAGLNKAVDYLPPLADDAAIAGVLRQCSIAVSVAASDGTPVSVLEGMACGCALVLGDIPALQGWASQEDNALLVPLGSPEQLARSILRLIEDPPLRQRLASAALQTVRQRANRDAQFDQLENIYHQVSRHPL